MGLRFRLFPEVVPIDDSTPQKTTIGDEAAQADLRADAQPDSAAQRPAPRSATQQLLGLMHNRWAVLSLLFLVTGFLGLPVLWASNAFSVLEKVVISVVNIIYTLALIYGTYLVCLWAWNNLVDAMGP